MKTIGAEMRPFAQVFDIEHGVPTWLKLALEKADLHPIDPYYLICWDGHVGNLDQKIQIAKEDAERVALEVFDFGNPIYTLTRPEHDIPYDVVVVVTNS